jgi:hypothetical protein
VERWHPFSESLRPRSRNRHRASFGTRHGGRAVYCGLHKPYDSVDVVNLKKECKMEGCHTHTIYKRRDGTMPMFCLRHRSAPISREDPLCAQHEHLHGKNQDDVAANTHSSSGNASDANARLVPPEVPFPTLDRSARSPRGGRGRPPSQTCHFAEGCARQPVTPATPYRTSFRV